MYHSKSANRPITLRTAHNYVLHSTSLMWFGYYTNMLEYGGFKYILLYVHLTNTQDLNTSSDTYEVLILYKLIDTIVLIHINYERKPEKGILSYV